MATTKSDTAKARAKRWGLEVKHALYRKTGDWYHKLERFPGALLDEHGYVLFETREGFESCAWLRIRQDVGVPDGIKRIPGYVWVSEGSDFAPESTSYEVAVHEEGNRTNVVQSRPERNPDAREECVKHYGFSCWVCGFNFERHYGPIGARFIHVHHLQPISEGVREVDAVRDLRPLCPNCHAMAHKRNPPFTIEELRQCIREHRA